MTESEKLSVFLCHSPADKAAIRDLHARLLKHSWIDPWLDEEKLLPGHDRNGEINKAVEKAHVIIIGLSKDSITKEGHAQAEFKYAQKIALEKLEGAIFIIPLNIEDVKGLDIPSKLKDIESENYFPAKRRVVAFERILRSLKVRADMLGIPCEENASIATTPRPSKDKYSKENIAFGKGVVSNAEFPICEIPFRKNINFTGRKDVIDSIHEEFSAAKNRVPVHAVRGMGGIGKTQIAVHYSYEFAEEYDLVYWVRSETDASLTADYEALTQTLQLPVKTKAEQLVYVNIVNNWLGTTDKKWLLVFDNVESQEKIEKLLPHKGNGHILITSQNPNWKELGQDSQIRPFSNEIAKEFLEKRIGGKGLEYSDRLNELLGGLPLALEQASAYMTAHGTPIDIYIKLFEEQQEELWKRETPPKEYKSTIMTTWEMAFKKIRETHPAAEQLLGLFSFFGPDDIPLSIIKTYSNILPKDLKEVVLNSIELEENLSAIYSYSLAERNEGFISFHRLVQDVIRTRLSKEQAAQWVITAIQIVKMAFPYDEYDIKTWVNCSQLLPHALAAANYAEKYNTGLEGVSDIYQKVGEYLASQAEYERAGDAIKRVINIRQEILGANHEMLAASLDYLGEIRQEQANYSEAFSLHNQAFEIFQTKANLETQQVARNLNNLGHLFRDQGNFEGASKYNEQALAIRRVVLGGNHPETATSLNNIGGLLGAQGKFELAQTYYEEALTIDRTVLGENHPYTAGALNNLGTLFAETGNFELAKDYFQDSVTILKSVLGDNHPATATALSNLANMFEKLGDLEKARKYYETSLSVRLSVFGENHPDTATSLNNIGTMFFGQSKYVDARHYFERAISIIEKVHGAKHYSLIASLGNLAAVMVNLRLFPLARLYFDRAEKICSESTVKYIECEKLEKIKNSIPVIGKTKGKKKKIN